MSDSPSPMARAARRSGYGPDLGIQQQKSRFASARVAPTTRAQGMQNVMASIQRDPRVRWLLAMGVPPAAVLDQPQTGR